MKAGKLALGIPPTEQAIRAGHAHLVLLDEGASALSQKSVRDACAFRGVRLITVPEGAIGDAVGRPGRMAVAVTDAGLAGALLRKIAPDDISGQAGPEHMNATQSKDNAGVHE